MSTPKSGRTLLQNFLDVQLKELLAMPDEEVLEGADPAAVKAEGLRMLEAAKAEAGKRRLAAARALMSTEQASARESVQSGSVAEARAYLKKAANDPRFTLAARELGEMSDEDVIRLYRQIRLLESQVDTDSGEGK